MIVALIESAPVSSFNSPKRRAAWCVAHDKHPSAAAVHPGIGAVGFYAVRAHPATITLVAFGYLGRRLVETHIPLLRIPPEFRSRPYT